MTNTQTQVNETQTPTQFKATGSHKSTGLAISMAMGVGAFVIPAIGCLGILDGQLNRQDLILLIAGFPIMIVMLWYAQTSAHALLSMSLTVSAKGITWKNVKNTIESDWDNVLKLAPVSIGKRTVMGLKLGKQTRIIRPGEKNVPPDSAEIPLEYFGDPKHGKLREALERYIPRVYQ